MGYTVSAGTLIILIGVFVSLSTIAPSAIGTVNDYREGQHAFQDDLLEQQNTAVNLTSATYNQSSDTLTVSLTNTGTTTLDIPQTDLLIDGEYSIRTSTVEGSTTRRKWMPGETLTFETTTTPTPNTVKVITSTGISVRSPVEVL